MKPEPILGTINVYEIEGDHLKTPSAPRWNVDYKISIIEDESITDNDKKHVNKERVN